MHLRTSTSLKATPIISLLEQIILPAMASYEPTLTSTRVSTISPEILIGKLLIWRNEAGELNEGIIREIVGDKGGHVIAESWDNLRWAVK